MKPYLKVMRPKQWSKNLLVFAAILFTNELRDGRAWGLTLLAFAGMCLLSSATYILNDLRDIEKDRSHPTKRLRPIASGLLDRKAAIVLAILCVAVSFALLILVGKKAVAVALAYAVLQVLYNMGVKTAPVLDVFMIGAGFVLRAVLGAAAIDRTISAWLLLCTGALALLLGFSKRRHEFISQGDHRTSSRESLAYYSRPALDALVIMTATAASLCYGIYALESVTAQKHPALFLTTIFVFYGICRYVLIVFVSDEGGEPETLLFKDRHILACVVLFIVTAALAVTTNGFPLIDTGTRL